MTEYTTSPEAIEVFRHSKERTAHWVRSHSPFHGRFRSPESPPTVIEELDPESDHESSHSLPPKMVLRYGNGRADIPISHWHYENAHDPHKGPPRHGSNLRPRPHTTYHTHDRSRSAADAYPPHHSRYHDHAGPHYHFMRQAPQRVHEEDFSMPPEEINILPSDPNAQPHRSTGTYRPRRSSEPFRHQSAQSPYENEEELPEPPAPRYISNNVDMPPPVMYSHSQHIHDPYDHHHPSHSHSRGNRPPPSIVYAPGHHHSSDHYAPPTIVYAPHKAPGMTYTVSAPTGSGFPQYPRITATPYPSVHSNLDSVQEEPRYGPRGPRPRDDIIHRAPSPISEAATGDSGSTYYVIPTPGQKVKVLVGPEASLYTATSTTKSASSPHSPHSGTSGGGGGFKKPLFRRLISFASDLSRSSKGSRSSKKKLQRRHSIDTSARAPSNER
ncbi:hypothetical protein BS17DRAFT_791978 [Gyrodon lividus]|nr:hypothetical protein BS17DRAFT_791978 [Gyrodon lividus]